MQSSRIEIITGIQTKPRPRFARIGKFINSYTPKTALSYERYIASEYQRLGGKYYGDKPIYIYLAFYFKTPATMQKYGIWVDNIACTKHKDLDNLGKAVLDALNTIAYDDDKQVVSLEMQKFWTNEQEKIIIFINETPDLKTEQDFKEFWKQMKKEKKNELKKQK